jgi:hypothetical protein
MEEVARSIQQHLKISEESEPVPVEPLVAKIPESPSITRDIEGTLAADDEENDAAEEFNLQKEPSELPVFRKVLPTLEEEEGACCSICLDDFTQEDPAIATTCG